MRPRRTVSRGRTDSRQVSSCRRWATPTRVPPANGVCSGFSSKETWIHVWRWFIKMTHKSDPWKNITKNKCHACKKRNLSWKHYSNKRNCMQGSFLNTTPSIQKYNSRISVILIYYYALCKGSRWAWERCSRCVFCYRCRHKYTCDVVIATTNSFGAMCIFF
jgi:hypothetical protein